MTGSSRLPVMKKAPESLAGRYVIREPFPLTVPELGSERAESTVLPRLPRPVLYSAPSKRRPS